MVTIKQIKKRLKPIKQEYIKLRYAITKSKMRKRLKNKDFTIISDNCWAGRVHEELGIPYTTPFIGMFIYSEDYVKLVKNFEDYMNSELSFIKESRWKGDYNGSYPLGLLNDIEIHFLHYESEESAYAKWNRRKKRINYDNLFFKMNDDNKCTFELLKEFDHLDLAHKVIFSAVDYKELNNLVYFSEARGDNNVGADLFYYDKYFDVVTWLNGEKY